MSDLIDRQAAIKAIDDLPNCYNGYSDAYDKAYIIGVLEDLPPAQPEIIPQFTVTGGEPQEFVPIVRCKDCKHLLHFLKRPNEHRPGETTPEHWNCTLHEKAYSPSTTPDGFCDEAERGDGRWTY